ncbi:MAG: sugar phosphate isomerase/epimerase [Planctomycetales bacterium]|nr:sugar phosphate isomerase/epimerase [Planctomycetales bacterium]
MLRRDLLRYGSLLSTIALTSTSKAFAIDAFQRSAPGRLRLSLAAYSMRKYLAPGGNESRRLDLFDFVDFCREHGLDGTELTSYYFPPDVDDDYLFRLRRHCHLAGITISGGAIRNDYCSLDSEKVASDLEHTKLWIDRYALLGAPVIRIFAGQGNDQEPLSTTLSRCARNCEIACEYAAKKGLILALENHGGVTARADDLIEIVRQVDSPAFGINFDSGNFRGTEDPYQELAKIAPYAVNAQIKVEIQVDGKKQEADLKRILEILRSAGYSGWVALEYEATEEPWEAIPRWLSELKKLLD